MKDSGVPRLGGIPENWTSGKLRNILKKFTKRNRPDLSLLSVVREKGVILRDINNNDENHNFIPDDLSNYKVVRRGQFVMNKMKAWQGSYGISGYDGIVSPAYFIFDIDGVDESYFHSAIRSRAYIPFFTQASDGVRIGQWDLSHARMKEIPFFMPPLAEQRSIVRFLDYVDNRIHRYIRAKQKLIRLLEEQKQVSINHAVTRGLDPNVSMKDSGVAWLGDIPSHWDSIRTRFLLREVDLRSLDGFEDPLAMSQKLGLVPADQVERTLSSRSNVGAKLCQPGDLVLNRLKAHLGVFAIAHDSGLVSPDYSVFRLRAEGIPGYYELLLKCNSIRAELRRRTKGIVEGFWRLYTDDFFDIRLPIPPVSEQAEILSWALGETRETTRTVASLEHEISLLREFRTRLTSDAVTGQVDVREIAASLPEVAPYELADVVEGSMDDELDELAEESTKHGALV